MSHDSRTETEGERRFNAITAAYVRAVERGEVPDRDKIVARDPDLADRLRRFFENDDGLNRMLAPLRKAVQTPRVESEVTIGFQPSHPGRVLETLAKSIGSIPRVLLPDTQVNDPGAPLVQPSSTEMPPPGDRADRYQIIGEIAHGGMGAILKGRDTDLGRELAVKVLLERHQDEPEMVRRFVEEAQIGGQLQHPGIVPVYELGTFSDQRPYFTMKLVKGRTLAAILSDRKGPTDDLPRLLGIFEQICQTLAYAHARSVIHRDLKPSNIMVGGFGEVQVMDWGLAKVLKPGGAAEEESTAPAAPAVSVIRTVRSGSALDASRAGSVLGTLAYMPPEQAYGEVEKVDQRADVFGLGSILCEILTGQPAYTGRTPDEVRRKAERGDTADALKRLGASQCDPDLVALAKDCLVVEPLDRPRDASVVLARVTAYLTGVQEKLRAAELARVEAQARAEEEVKRRELADRLTVAAEGRAVAEARRRKATLGLAAVSVVAVMLLVGIGVGLAYQRRLQRAYQNEQRAREDEAKTRYFNDMILANREWSSSNVRRVKMLLDEWVPKPGQEADRRGWEWHYLKQLCQTGRRTLSHSGVLESVAYSPDGRFLAGACSVDGTVTIWDANRGETIRTLSLTRAAGVAYSSDGKYLAGSGGTYFTRGEVKVWDTSTWRELWLPLAGVTGEYASVAFSPDDTRLAVACGEWELPSRISIVEVKSGKVVRVFPGPSGGLLSIVFSPDGNHLATARGHLDSAVFEKEPPVAQIWDADSGKLLRTFEGHTEPLTSVAFSPNGTNLATSSWDLTIRVWDIESAKEVRNLTGHDLRPNKVVFSPDGKWLASGSEGSSITIWETETYKELAWLRGHTGEVYGLAFRRDGRRLASASHDATIKVWDVEPKLDAATLHGHSGWVNSAAYSPDSRLIATAGIDKTVKVWDANSNQLLFTLKGHTGPVLGVAFSPNGALIASAGGNWKHTDRPGEVRVWDVESRTEVRRFDAHAGLARGVAFSPDGQQLASVGGERNIPSDVRTWTVGTWDERPALKGHTKGLLCLAYSRDGLRFASAGYDHAIKLWDAKSGAPAGVLDGRADAIVSIAFSPDGEQLASAGIDGIVRVWDVSTAKEIRELPGRASIFTSVAFSRDGKRLATGAYIVTLWDVATGRETLTLDGHNDLIWSVSFSPDGSHLASASQDGTVKIWDGTP